MLIVFSAGNYGTAANPRRSQQGFVDWYSIASPATAKNAITVGAGRSDKMIGPSSGQTHSARWPGFFPDKPISDEPIVGSVDSLYGPSSRGPCKGGLIKPDIIAPGTDIASTWPTTLAPGAGVQWGAYAGNPFYAYCGGTSMAAPIVAGCALLVREYFLSIGVKPSAAAVKATLINSARWMAGKDAVADHPTVINMHQGFGRLYMPWAIPNPMEPWLKLAFADTWKDANDQLQRSGQTHYYSITVNGGAFLRICLAFTDLPAGGRQHEVHLIVRKGSADFFGNQNGYDNDKVDFSAGEGDEHNNVEVVRIDNPSGTYNIEIFARNLRETPQDYALVVAGDLATTGRLKRVP